ncbi:hypothetical protein [Latilactobacillus fragifolii]|uniref:hypothetical protein n=1 Tax=Latilactobacillus fragifolii TaxID=2814244 RepID=UPI001ABAF3F9|nr:hypothetical protein [Latilactobacillus fragifolii]
MKYVFAQPAKERFSWELKTAIYSLKELGVPDADIVVLFAEDNEAVANAFGQYDVHIYQDDRYDKNYIPSIRPYLWWKYLDEDASRENENYVYLDSDVVILDLSVFKVHATEKRWYASNANGYLNYDYLKNVSNSEVVIDSMCQTLHIPQDWLKSINKNSGGAQWVIRKPKAGYWHDVYVNSIELYNCIKPLKTNLQKWTAEMWAQLWTMYHYGIKPMVNDKLEFAWSTDDSINDKKIIHNAGVTVDTKLFFKGNYNETPPLSALQQDSGKVSDLYVRYVREANYGK